MTVSPVTEDFGVLGLMGPISRDVLAHLTDADLNAGFPWLSVRVITVAGISVRALRVSYVGELGWELHMAAADMPELFDVLEAVGAPNGPGFFGAYAMNSMRLEKGYRAWGGDFTTERTPAETGAGFLVKHAGREFIGRDALASRLAAGDRWDMALLEVEAGDVDPFYAMESIRATRWSAP